MNKNEQFFKKKKQQLGVNLNPIQKQAVLNTEGPLLLLASPGSGKTTTIIMRIGYLIEVKGVLAHRIKAVTFSKAAALDMKERFSKFFPSLPMVDFSTIHSLAFRIVREYYNGAKLDYHIIEGQQTTGISNFITKNQLLRQLYKEVNKEFITEDQLEELTTYISYVKNKMLPKDQWDIDRCKVPKKVEILEKYESYKMSSPILLMDFDDMLIRANQILNLNEEMLKKYQQQFDYVLTDESQDTSMVQHAIIEKLVAQHENLCVVADEDQSIYGWRGAEVGYLLDFKKTYPKAEVLMMVQNYRSSKDIVRIADEFIKQNKQRYDKNMITENPPKKPIQLKEVGSYQGQQNYLVKRIKELGNFSTIAILYRNNSSAITLMDLFDRNGIPFYMKDVEMKFFSHWVVEDILNFLRFSYDDTRLDIFEKIYLKFEAYISKVQFEQLTKVYEGGAVLDTLLKENLLKDYQIEKLKLFKKIIEKLKGVKPTLAIQMIRHKLGYEKMLKNRSEKFGYQFDNLMDILNTLELIAESTDTVITFAHRLKHLEKMAMTSSANKEENAVNFLTMHRSKGLEFETVFVIDLIEGVIPSVKLDDVSSKEDKSLKEEYEEEVRLFYVAMTRAITNLELLTYSSRFEKKVEISTFYHQIDALINPNKVKEKDRVKEKSVDIQLNPNSIQDPSIIQNGLVIHHRVFGEGTIQSNTGGVITIQFNSQLKKFELATCIKYGLLEPVE